MTTTDSGHPPLPAKAAEPADEFLWLEDIYGEAPLVWVRERNARTDGCW